MLNQQVKPDQKVWLRGQALIEYVLILVLAFVGLIAILAITTPAVGNVFSNTVYNLLGQTTTPQEPMSVSEFWDQVTAVASFTPETVDLITNTPLPDTVVPTDVPTFTPTPLTPSPTASNTPTPGPSPTPADQDYDYPFEDDGSGDDDWQTDGFPDLFEQNGPWAAEYWNFGSTGNGKCSNSGDGRFNQWTGIIPAAAHRTAQVDEIDFPNAENPVGYWHDESDRPHPDLNTDFCSRFTISFYVPSGTYRFIYKSDDHLRLFVIDGGGTTTRIINAWTYVDQEYHEVEWTNAVSENKTFRIVHRDTGGGGHLGVRLEQSSLSSDDNCTWETSGDRPHTPPESWDDSPGAEYQNNQHCTLRLRGTIDLSGATRPFLEFWEAYELNTTNDKVIVAIAIEGTDVWNEKTLHTSTTNFAYTRQSFDLTAFAGNQGTVNYAGQHIELSFTIDTDNSNRDDGWWVDDIKVYEKPDRVFTIGFADDVEGETFWVNQGTWARTAEKAHSGTYVWSDSPSSSYTIETENYLELDGRLDLTQGTVNRPEIAFWHSWDLNSNDKIYLQISDDRQTWVNLRTSPTDSTEELQGTGVEANFVEASAEIPAPYSTSSHVYVRFRLSSDLSNVADGWYIDDIEFRNKPIQTVTVGWCDNMETGTGSWLPEGTWALTNTQRHGGVYAWTDSPGGNYAHNTNSSLVLRPVIDLSVPATRPVLEFWSMWDLNSNTQDKLYVQVSPDEGANWTTVWSFTQSSSSRLPGWGSSITSGSSRYSESLAWYRSTIELTGLPALVAPASGYQVRFRLDALTDTDTADGWYIDDICVKDYVPFVYTPPFVDDLEDSDFNWIVMGQWQLSNASSHSSTIAFNDSPSGTYLHDTFHLVELGPTIDLNGTTNPTLYYWEKYEAGDNDNVFVQMQAVTATGVPLTDWEYATTTGHYEGTNLGWSRMKVDLKPILDTGYRYFRMRFELDGLDASGVGDGWVIDDISIIDNVNEILYEIPYFEDAELLTPGEWVFGHEWDTVEVNRDLGTGGALGPGQWQATWYDGVNTNCSTYATLTNQANTTTVDELDFNWGNGNANSTDAAGLSGDNDNWGASFTRNFLFAEDTTFSFTGYTNNGVRILIDGVELTDPNNYWRTCGWGNINIGPYTFTGGVPHNVEVQYYERSGTAEFNLSFSGPSNVFHESPLGNYTHRTDNFLELEGEIDLAGTANPVLLWDERYNIGTSDYIRVEISTDKGFTWTSLYERWNSTDWNWTEVNRDLTAYAGQKVVLRFRLNALSNSGVADGWWIDNIRVVE